MKLQDPDTRALWQAVLAGAEPFTVPPDQLIAVYLDGRATEAESDQVEAWLARDPEGLDLLLAFRTTEAEAVPLASPDLVRDLRAAVGGALEAHRPASPVSSWRQRAIWGAMAASILIAAVVGFSAGSEHARVGSIEAAFGAQLGLGDSDGDVIVEF